MKLSVALLREPGERPLPREMLTPNPKGRGRPRKEYRPRVRSSDDVERLRRHRVPAYLLTSDRVTEAGYPVRFPSWLALPEAIASQVTSDFRILPVKDSEALNDPGIAELIALLLKFDPLAARLVAVRHRRTLDPNELYRRVRNEGVERAATKVRLQEFSPAIPVVGVPLPRSEIRWIERNNAPSAAAV